MFHALFGLDWQGHDVFLLLLSCPALDRESADVPQVSRCVSDERFVDNEHRSDESLLQHRVVVDEIEWVFRVVNLLLPDAGVKHVNEVSLWRVLHLHETLWCEENSLLCLMLHEEVLHDLIEHIGVELFLLDPLALED